MEYDPITKILFQNLNVWESVHHKIELPHHFECVTRQC